MTPDLLQLSQVRQVDLRICALCGEQLQEVNVDGVEPITSVVDMDMRKRHDEVTDGNKAVDVTANAPMSEDNFFMVPKVVE